MKVSDYIIKGEANVAKIEELIAIAEGKDNEYTKEIEKLKESFAVKQEPLAYTFHGDYCIASQTEYYYTKKEFKSIVIKALKSNLNDSNALIKTLTKNKLVRILFKKQIESYEKR